MCVIFMLLKYFIFIFPERRKNGMTLTLLAIVPDVLVKISDLCVVTYIN